MMLNSMSNSPGGCDCNDYSKKTANTGIVTISTANPNLDGLGTLGLVMTGSQNGTRVTKVKIVANDSTIQGMVRLFIGKDNPASTIMLYAEVPIPTYPALATTPTPTPVMSKFEATISVDWYLPNGYRLLASTQNSNSFNIIAEGLDWDYPDPIPDTCCNFVQQESVSGLGMISLANTIVEIFRAPVASNGATIESIAVKALQSTNEGMVKLYLSEDGVTYKLFQEVWIPPTIQSGLTPSFQIAFDTLLSYLKAGYFIGASTLLNESFAITVTGKSWTYPI